MGIGIQAKCGLCYYEIKFSLGAGKFTYHEKLLVPAINVITLEFENVNFIDQNLNINNYKFYHDSELKGDNLDYTEISWSNVKLNRVNNLCPKCNKYNFHFKDYMFFD